MSNESLNKSEDEWTTNLVILLCTISVIVATIMGAFLFTPTTRCVKGKTEFLLRNSDESTMWYSTEHKCK